MSLGLGKKRKYCREDQSGHQENADTFSARHNIVWPTATFVQGVDRSDKQDQYDKANDQCYEAVDSFFGEIMDSVIVRFFTGFLAARTSLVPIAASEFGSIMIALLYCRRCTLGQSRRQLRHVYKTDRLTLTSLQLIILRNRSTMESSQALSLPGLRVIRSSFW